MKYPQLDPKQLAEVDAAREGHRANQPYASELEDRELESAQKEKRPVRGDLRPRRATKKP